MKTKIILTADDFGVVPQINNAVIDLINKGVLNSTEVLSNYGEKGAKSIANTIDLINKTEASGNQYELGAHLTITSGKPIKNTPGLRNIMKGEQFGSYKNLSSNATLQSIYDELERQVDVLRNNAKIRDKVTHITNHHDALWFYPNYTDQLLKLSEKLKLPIRNPISFPSGRAWVYYCIQFKIVDMPRDDQKAIKEAFKLRNDGFFKIRDISYRSTEYMDNSHYSLSHLGMQVKPKKVDDILKKKKKKLDKMFKRASKLESKEGRNNVVEYMFHVRKGKVSDYVTYQNELSYYNGINPKYFDGRTVEYRSLNKHKEYILKKLADEFEKESWKSCESFELTKA